MSKIIQKIGVVGAGAWGTALAITAQRAGRDVIIHAHEANVANTINQVQENTYYLPGVQINKGIWATTELEEIASCEAIFLAIPAQFMRETTSEMKVFWQAGVPAVICAKGIEQETGSLLSEIVAQTLPDVTLAILSGPTFAIEVAKGLPTAVTLASKNANALRATLAVARW